MLWTVAGISLFGMMLAGALLTLMVVVAMGTQRVEIDGTSVRVANLVTLHRWRAFDVNDVIGLHLIGLHNESLALVVQLAPAPQRAWCRIDITSTMNSVGHRDIDSALFVALFQAVLQARPGMKVANLPPTYDGALRRPRARR